MAKRSKKTLASKLGKGADLHPLPWEVAKDFVLAGYCVVTLEEIATGDRNTYFVSQVVDEEKDDDGKVVTIPREKFFVNLLVGSDNTRSFKYLGFVDKRFGGYAFRTTAATTKNAGATAENINRFGDVLKWMVESTSAGHKVRIWHRGFCAKCGKDLTVPGSIATGFGPDCAKQLGIAMKSVDPTAVEKLASLAPVVGDTSFDTEAMGDDRSAAEKLAALAPDFEVEEDEDEEA